MAKKKTANALNISKQITSKIPYERCYDEYGIFETGKGRYSKAYCISLSEESDMADFNQGIVEKRFSKLLNELPYSVTMQFIIHNKLISQKDFLKKVLVIPNKEDKVNKWIDKYNETISENASIGHNNVKKNKYFVVSLGATTPDKAYDQFKELDKKIKGLFKGIYGIKANELTTVETLKVMYEILNPKLDNFGKKADLHGNGDIKLANIKKLKLTTKDCIAPKMLDISNKNYIVLNNDTYVRTFFITSMPTHISNNLIFDITNISSNMVFSAIYEPVDSKYGYNIATKKVAENTVIKQSYKRDTIKDRREKVKVKTETMIEATEQAYFDRCALDTIKEAVAIDEKSMLCSFIIAIYADDLETLERDTKLLYISTSKFACQVKSLDLQQIRGLQSVLPLGKTSLDVRRFFTVHKLATIPPLDLQTVLQKDGLFYGLNSINDNLILLNRKNTPNMAGIISGSDHSGKTFQNKREIFNAAISTKDKIFIVSDSDDYDEYVKEIGGCIVNSVKINPFAAIEHYGLINPDKYSKALMLEALVETITRPKDKSEALKIDERERIDKNANDRNSLITKEVKHLLNLMDEEKIDFSDYALITNLIEENADKLPLFTKSMERIRSFAERENEIEGKSRIQLYKVRNSEEKIVTLDYLFNRSIQDKMKNTSTWLFIDAIDDMFVSEEDTNYLLDYVEKMNALGSVFTAVIQSAVKLFTDNLTSFRTEDFINAVGYYKLLNQGAIERKRFTELLNISNSLVNYITSAELGKGIILTSASNSAFDDNFYGTEEADDKLYSLFKI